MLPADGSPVSSLNIDRDHLDLLALGLHFIPALVPKQQQQTDSLESAFSRLRATVQRAHHFDNCADTRRFKSLKTPKSQWLPPAEPDCDRVILDELHDLAFDKVRSIYDSRASLSRSRQPCRANLSARQHRALLSLAKRNDIIVSDADKNLGVCVVDKSAYHRRVMLHLNDTTHYERLSLTPLTPSAVLNTAWTRVCRLYTNTTFLRCLPTLHADELRRNISMFIKRHSENKLASFRLPRFYIIPKVHKHPWAGRPIAAAHSYVTSHPSTLLGLLLREHAINNATVVHNNYAAYNDALANTDCHTVLRNSAQLVARLETLVVPNDIIIATADVEALYPSLSWQLMQTTIAEIADSSLGRVGVVIQDLLKLVLENNIVTYDDNLYWQKQGIPMGTNGGVDIANAVLQVLELKVIASLINSNRWPPGSLYKRYVDDLFIIWNSNSRDSLDYFLDALRAAYNVNIVLTGLITGQPGEHIDFLDVKVLRSPTALKHLAVQPHQKLLNSYQYIPYKSLHRREVFRAFIKGELTRFATLSTDVSHFAAASQLFYNRLRARGYPPAFTTRCFASVTHSDRHFYLGKQCERQTTEDDTRAPPERLTTFVLPHTPVTEQVPWRELLTLTRLRHKVSPSDRSVLRHVRLAWSRISNLRQLLRHNADTQVAPLSDNE